MIVRILLEVEMALLLHPKQINDYGTKIHSIRPPRLQALRVCRAATIQTSSLQSETMSSTTPFSELLSASVVPQRKNSADDKERNPTPSLKTLIA